jgi:peptide/nickel transport system permease protein
MLTFLLKRLLHTVPILLGVSLLTFMLMSLTPGDYYTQLSQNPQITPEKLAELRAKQHLDRAWYVRYGYWLKDAAHGDLGYSIAYKISVSRLIVDRLWNTFLLSAGALVLAWGVAVPLGIWAALNKDSWVDRLCAMIAFVGLSVPDILLALLALMFAAATGLLPVGGAEGATYDLMTTGQQIWDRAHHLILPVIVLAASDLAGIMRQMRSNFLDTMRAEFVTTARAKGLAEGWVIYKHTLRNAINPLLTLFGYSLAGLLSGAFIVENIMAWPGLGRLTMDALNARDYPLVVASVVMAAALLVAGNFVADLLLAWSDPRIRLNK